MKLMKKNNTMKTTQFVKLFITAMSLLIATGLYAGEDKHYKTALEKMQIQDYHGAIMDFSRSLKKDTKHLDSYLGRAKAKIHLQDYYGAIQDYTEVINLDKKSSKAYLGRGRCYYALNQFEDAIRDFTKDIELKANLEEAYFERAKSEKAIKAYNESIDDFTRLIEINPNNKDAYFLRGMILITIDQKSGGCLDLSKAGELGDVDAYEMIRTYCQKD